MVSDAQIRELGSKIAAETDPWEIQELLAGLQMVALQYLRERAIFFAHSNPATHQPNGRKKGA